jgi:hypothetical protein
VPKHNKLPIKLLGLLNDDHDFPGHAFMVCGLNHMLPPGFRGLSCVLCADAFGLID